MCHFNPRVIAHLPYFKNLEKYIMQQDDLDRALFCQFFKLRNSNVFVAKHSKILNRMLRCFKSRTQNVCVKCVKREKRDDEIE